MHSTLTVFLLALSMIQTKADFTFTIQGNITADNSGAPYMVNDDVNFNFSIRLQGEDNVTAITFKFISETLMFLPETDRSLPDQISWFYDKAEASGSTVLHDRTSNTTFTEHYDANDDSISVYFPFRGWASELFYGQLSMLVRDSVGPGRKLGCKAVVSYYRGPTSEFVSREIESTYTFSELPRLGLTSDYPVYLRVLESTSVRLTLDLPRGLTQGSVQVVMPISATDNIPKMSLKDFRVVANQSIPQEEVAALACTYDSVTLPGTNDLAVVSPMDLTVNDTSTAGNNLELEFDVQTEIYRGIENVSEIWVGGGVKFGNSFLWVAEAPVYLLDDYDRVSKVNHSLVYISEYGYDGEMTVTLEVQFSHEASSTDHAYDMTLILFLTPLMTSVNIAGSYQLGVQGSIHNSSEYILTIDRILLDQTLNVRLNISFDVSDSRFWLDDTFMVVTEMFYYGGYKNSTEQITDLQHTAFQLDLASAEQFTFTDGFTCTCDFDPGRSDCGCCRPGGCQCGETNPAKCSDCRKPWRCKPYLNEFDRESQLNGVEYVCRAYQLYRPIQSGVSCYREKVPGSWAALSPSVGVVLGRNSLTGTLYGISNTGDGYVISDDEGITWASVNADLWTKANSQPNYVSATFANY